MEPKHFLLFEKNKALIVHIGGYHNNLEMQRCCLESFKILKSKKLNKVLVDLTKLEVLMNISQVWAREKFIPRVRKYGTIYVAFIIPIGFLEKEDFEKMNSGDSQQSIQMKFFESETSANSWLNTVN